MYLGIESRSMQHSQMKEETQHTRLGHGQISIWSIRSASSIIQNMAWSSPISDIPLDFPISSYCIVVSTTNRLFTCVTPSRNHWSPTLIEEVWFNSQDTTERYCINVSSFDIFLDKGTNY